jgi:hypothetical protein
MLAQSKRRLIATAVVLACGVGRAQAQAPAALSWVREPGAEGCIGAPELGTRVERLVGPVLVAAPSGEVSVEGKIGRRGQHFAALIVISDAHGAVLGERAVQGRDAAPGATPDCRALDDQLAFVIAVAIDPNAALAELPGELAPEGDPGAELLAELRANPPRPAQPVVERATEPPSNAPVSREPGAPAHVLAGAGVRLGLGMLPAASASAQLELGFGLEWFTQRARLSLARSQSVSVPDARVELAWLELGTASCAELARASGFAFELCAGVAAAHLDAHAIGFPGRPQRRWLFGPRADARIARMLAGPVWVALEGSLLGVWPKHRVVYEDAGVDRELYRVPGVSAAISALIELRWSL